MALAVFLFWDPVNTGKRCADSREIHDYHDSVDTGVSTTALGGTAKMSMHSWLKINI